MAQAPVQFWHMKTILFFCISSALLTASTLLTGCTAGDESGTPQVQTSDNSSGEPAAALAVAHWVKGEPVDVSSGVHVVEFWATWCPPCLTSIPHLTELQEKFKDRGVNIIGVSDEELHSYVAGGFGIREMMVHASRMRHELQQRGNDA